MPLIHNNVDHFERNDTLPRSYQEDIVDELYTIHAERPINELSNQFSRYYFASHLETEKEYFAIIFERNFNPPVRTIELLKKHPVNGSNRILTYSLVKLSTSRKYQLVVIVEAYDPEQTLQHYIETNGPMNIDMMQNSFLPPMIKSIEFCHTHGMNCSNINPQNIIVTKNNTFILREFISALPNFYQPFAYLAPEIGDTIEQGRTKGGVAADIYALGMTAYYAMTGRIPSFSTHNPRIANAERIEEGSFNVISRKAKIPKIFRDFFAATLNDDPVGRVDITELCDWFSSPEGKKFKIVTKSHIPNHTILFEGHNYSNPVAMASAMYSFYESAVKFYREENFVKWLQRVKNKGDNIADILPFNFTGNNVFSGLIDNETEEKMLKVFALLDNYSPLKIKDFCITLESIPHFLFSIVYNDNTALLTRLSQALRRNYWKMVLSPEYREQLPHGYVETLVNLSSAFSNDTSEYTLKKQLYLMDPYVPCLSPSIIGDYVLSIGDLLVSLDRIAAHSASKIHIDEHIAAFIYSRLNSDTSSQEKLDNIPEHLTQSIMLQGIFWLSIAQDNASNIKVPHLSSIIAQKLIEWINDNLHSTKLKKIITSEIAELSTTGSLSQMLYVISNPQLFYNDYRGYKVARKQIGELERDIKYLSDEDQMDEVGILLGQKLTVLFSYFLCMVVALILVI